MGWALGSSRLTWQCLMSMCRAAGIQLIATALESNLALFSDAEDASTPWLRGPVSAYVCVPENQPDMHVQPCNCGLLYCW